MEAEVTIWGDREAIVTEAQHRGGLQVKRAMVQPRRLQRASHGAAQPVLPVCRYVPSVSCVCLGCGGRSPSLEHALQVEPGTLCSCLRELRLHSRHFRGVALWPPPGILRCLHLGPELRVQEASLDSSAARRGAVAEPQSCPVRSDSDKVWCLSHSKEDSFSIATGRSNWDKH